MPMTLEWLVMPEAAGTLRFHPTNSGDVLTMALMGIKATNYTVGWTQTSLPVAHLRRPCRILNVNALGRAEIAVFAEHSRAALTRATLVLRIHFKYFQRDGITTYTSTDRVQKMAPSL